MKVCVFLAVSLVCIVCLVNCQRSKHTSEHQTTDHKEKAQGNRQVGLDSLEKELTNITLVWDGDSSIDEDDLKSDQSDVVEVKFEDGELSEGSGEDEDDHGLSGSPGSGDSREIVGSGDSKEIEGSGGSKEDQGSDERGKCECQELEEIVEHQRLEIQKLDMRMKMIMDGLDDLWTQQENMVEKFQSETDDYKQNSTKDIKRLENIQANLTSQLANHGKQMEVRTREQESINIMMEEQIDYLQGTLKEVLTAREPIDCSDLHERGETTSGVYSIFPSGAPHRPVQVWCDMATSGGGWTAFQRRFDGSEDFYRGWEDYEQGFGKADSEYWLGLGNIFNITRQRLYELRVVMRDTYNNRWCAAYKMFKLDAPATSYRLRVGQYQEAPISNVGDSLTENHNGFQFTTYDRDNDAHPQNCAVRFKGAWWYAYCHASNLNGRYLNGWTEHFGQGVSWSTKWGYHYSMPATTMMIRPVGYPVFLGLDNDRC